MQSEQNHESKAAAPGKTGRFRGLARRMRENMRQVWSNMKHKKAGTP